MRQVYQSKIDAFVLIPSLLLPVAFVLSVGAHSSAQPHFVAVGLRVLLLVTMGFAFWVVLGTRYGLDMKALYIHCGPFQWTIALRDIRSVTPTRETRSSPALSLDRLRIEYGSNSYILISPRDQAAFLRDLEHRRQVTLQHPAVLNGTSS